MEKGLSFTPGCVVGAPSTLVQWGIERASPEYVLCLWVGWPLQHQIIDGPACQGVLIWDEVCQVGMRVMSLQPPVQSLTSVPSDTCVCDVEGCGLIADALNLLVKQPLGDPPRLLRAL